MQTVLRHLPLAVFLLLAGVYLLSTGGHTYASDEEKVLAVTEALVTRGSFAVGVDPDGSPRYGTYGPGQSIAAVPFYLAGRAIAGLFPPAGSTYVTRLAITWLNPLVTAATAALLVVAAGRLGYGRRAALGLALLYGLATMAWPHSKTFFAEPLAAALTFASFLVVLGPPPRPPALARSGLLAALACAVKIQAGVALPFLGLWVLWQTSGAEQGRPDLRRALRGGLAWGGGAMLSLGLLGLFQWALYGSPLRSGYGAAGSAFGGDVLEGVYGLLLSPGKGLIWYAPPLILLPIGLALLWRRSRGVAALCAALTVATVLFYARATIWHGDGAWGPRYLHMVLPFMALPLVAVLEPRATLARAAVVAVCLIAIPAQLGGLLISFNAYFGVQGDGGRRYFEPSQSPIVGHLRLAAAQAADAYALRLAPATLALADGFSYSEGDRSAGAQLPRWTLPQARVEIRPPAGSTSGVRLDLAASGCLPAPLPPSSLAFMLDGAALAAPPPCPPRRYAMLLPPGPATLTLQAPGWRPAEVGIDREEVLGVYITNISTRVGGAPLALAGRLVPIPPAPAGPVALRLWASDYRYGHWDLWPWYLAHAGLPRAPSAALAAVWLIVGLGAAGIGLLGLYQGMRRQA